MSKRCDLKAENGGVNRDISRSEMGRMTAKGRRWENSAN
jgi:hypothetical protein